MGLERHRKATLRTAPVRQAISEVLSDGAPGGTNRRGGGPMIGLVWSEVAVLVVAAPDGSQQPDGRRIGLHQRDGRMTPPTVRSAAVGTRNLQAAHRFGVGSPLTSVEELLVVPVPPALAARLAQQVGMALTAVTGRPTIVLAQCRRMAARIIVLVPTARI